MNWRGLRLSLFLLVLLGAVSVGFWWVADWMEKEGLPPSGGLYFPGRVVHDVPQMFQADPRWGSDNLGPTPGTLAAEGCAVVSAAMVLASYGADLDPGRLNAFLQKHEQGYTDRGWLYWEAASDYPPAVAEHVYEDDPSHFLIDWNLIQGNPVIVRLRYPSGITHFVVVVGKEGYDYLVRDPGSGGQKGIYPLHEFGSDIEALRFYRKLQQPGGTPVAEQEQTP